MESMSEPKSPAIAFRHVRELLLAMPQERNVASLLQKVVQKFAEDPELALTRIWLIQPGDVCSTCRLITECADQTRCLHLVAQSYGPGCEPREGEQEDDFHRIPLGAGKVGRCAVTGEVADAESSEGDLAFAVSQSWARRVKAIGLAVLPVVFHGKVLGVCGFVPWKEVEMEGEGLFWSRLVADHLAVAITNAQAFEQIETLNQRLADDNEYLNQELVETQAFGGIIGQSPSLNAVIRQIEMVADTDANILITGESGTGKELVAREVHKRSARAGRPLIKVNCASIPRELYESEFFGHLKGSFTGAVKDRKGRFELAHGGTLFLDEVGEIPLDMQSKLLRVLQEGEYERVGDEHTRSADVRILAATNRDLKQEVKAGRFREDLYYRLNVFPIELPPLRERMEDIPLLIRHFIELAGKKFNRTVKAPSKSTMSALKKYEWPGNIRELQNLVERAVITSEQGRLRFDLPGLHERAPAVPDAASGPEEDTVIPEKEMREREKENILRALRRCDGKIHGKDGAAALLGIKPTTLATRIKSMGLKKNYLAD